MTQHPYRFSKGFSLLELMVVVVIVAMIVGIAIPSFNINNPEDDLKQEALRFNRLLELMIDESVLRGTEIGMEQKAAGEYRFLLRTEQTNQTTGVTKIVWQPIGDKALRLRLLPEDMEMLITYGTNEDEGSFSLFDDQPVDTDDDEEKIATPQIIAMPSGELWPEEGVSVEFFYPSITTHYIVEASFNGKHTLTKNE